MLRSLHQRHVGRQRGQPLAGERLRQELDLARRGGRPVREGQIGPAHLEPHRALRLEPLEGDAGHRGVARVERLADQVVLALGEMRIAQPHHAGEIPRHRPVRARLTFRGDHRAGELEMEMPVGPVAVGVLHRGGGGQHEIGVVGGVGQVLLVHDREQVLAAEALEHQLLVRHDGGRVGVVDVERLDRRPQVRVGERAPELYHVDRARRRLRHQVRPLERRGAEPEGPARREQRASGRMRVGAGQRGQARDGPAGHAAVVVAGEPDADADERGPGGAVAARESHHVLRGEAGDPRDALRVVLLDVVGERGEAQRGPLDVLVIHPPLADQHVHHAQGQGPVRARARHQVPVGLPGGRGAVGIDADHEGAPAPRPLHQRHHVDVGVRGVDAPEHDQVGVHHLLGVAADHRAERRLPARVGGADADRALEPRGPEGVEERVAGAVLHEPEGAAVGERQERLRAPLGDDPPPAVRDLVERLVPADRLEPPLALEPDSPKGRGHSGRPVDPLRVVVHLAADHAPGEGVGGIADHVGDAGVLDRHLERALRRAVVRTDGRERRSHECLD